MQRWQLKKKFLFVDAVVYKDPENENYDTNQNEPPEIPYAHIMDKSAQRKDDDSPSPYLTLNPTAGFIARFIVQGVDTDDMLPQIIVSEYNIPLPQAKTETSNVLAMLAPYLKIRKYQRPHQNPDKLKMNVHPTGKYHLDFKVNWIGTGVLKGPL